MFNKIGLLKVFCKINRKTPVLESLFNKVTGLYPATLLKENTPIQVFSDEFSEIFKTSFLIKHLQATASVLRKNILPILKSPLKLLVKKKTKTHAEKKLTLTNTYLKSSYRFYYSKVSLFFCYLLLMIH